MMKVKKFLLIVLLLILPFLAACESTQEVIYYLDTEQTEVEIFVDEEKQLEIDTNITEGIEWSSYDPEVVSVDETGKQNGKGVYLKCDLEVVNKARSNKSLNRYLECEVNDSIYEEILNLIK